MQCPNCYHEFNPYNSRFAQEVKPKEIVFSNNGNLENATVKAYDDAFFEVVKGKYKGNLIHRFDVVFYL